MKVLKTFLVSAFIVFSMCETVLAVPLPPKAVTLTGLMILDPQRAAFTINPATAASLRINILNREAIRKKIAQQIFVDLVDAKIRIVRFTGGSTAEGEIVSFEISKALKPPYYDARFRILSPKNR